VALPEQIRKQSAAVQELYKQMNAEPEGEKPEGEPPSGDDYVHADEPVTEPVAPPPSGTEPTTGGERVAEEPVLQKYKTLQGMYNAEVPRLHQQDREKSQRIQQLEQLLASMSAQQQPQRPTEPAPTKLVSDKDVEEYGESLDVMRRVNREEMAPVMQRLTSIESFLQQIQSNMVPQLQQVQQRQAQSAEQTFWAGLSDAVSNWREINDDPAFQTWLMQVDPLTGISRQIYLEDAQRALDARRVSQFFRTWLEMNGGQTTVAQSNGQRTVSSAKTELEKQVAPGRSKNPGAPNPGKGKTYTPDDITKFFNEVKLGKYRGKEAERDRIERDIFAAQRENRIQFNA